MAGGLDCCLPSERSGGRLNAFEIELRQGAVVLRENRSQKLCRKRASSPKTALSLGMVREAAESRRLDITSLPSSFDFLSTTLSDSCPSCHLDMVLRRLESPECSIPSTAACDLQPVKCPPQKHITALSSTYPLNCEYTHTNSSSRMFDAEDR